MFATLYIATSHPVVNFVLLLGFLRSTKLPQNIAIVKGTLEAKALKDKMRERFMKFFFGKILREHIAKFVRADRIGDRDHDERHDMAVRFKKKSLFTRIFRDRKTVKTDKRVENISRTDTTASYFDMHE